MPTLLKNPKCFCQEGICGFIGSKREAHEPRKPTVLEKGNAPDNARAILSYEYALAIMPYLRRQAFF